MNINQLEYLVKAAEYGSYADAAKSLYVSPQAVSKALTDLEKELRVELFTKSGRGITPTSSGIILAEKAEEIIGSCGDLKNFAKLLQINDCSDSQIKGAIKLAVSSSPYEGGVISSEFFEEFSSKFPKIDLSVSYCSSGSGLTVLQEGIVDSAIILGRYKKEGFLCTKLFDIHMRVAVSRSHPLSKKGTVSIFDLKRYPVAKPNDLRYCSPIIEKHLLERNYTSSFVQLSHSADECARFFIGDNGVMFVLQDPEFNGLFDDMCFLELEKEEQIKIPVCFVSSDLCNLHIAALLQRNIVQHIKKSKSKR